MKEVEIMVADGDLRLSGTMTMPDHPWGIVLFAHGSGSSRFSPRNRRVAAAGALDAVTEMAARWFERHLVADFAGQRVAGR